MDSYNILLGCRSLSGLEAEPSAQNNLCKNFINIISSVPTRDLFSPYNLTQESNKINKQFSKKHKDRGTSL